MHRAIDSEQRIRNADCYLVDGDAAAPADFDI